jgi:hypothetical protein
MASVRLNGDTSGFIEISAPSVAGSTTITLPATSGGDFLVTDSNGDLNVDSGTLFVDASTNRVGIGTTSPGYVLDVAGSATGGIRYKASGSYGYIVADNTSSTGGGIFNAQQNGVQKAVFGVTGGLLGDTSADAAVFADTGQAIRFYTNGASERARIDSSGRLLVGTSSSDAQRTSKVQLAGNGDLSGWGSSLNLSEFGTNYNPWIALQRSRNSTIGSHTVVNSGDILGGIQFNGSDGNSFESGASIKCEVDTTPGDGDMPGRLVFSTTANGASSPTERVRIENTGVMRHLSDAPSGGSGYVVLHTQSAGTSTSLIQGVHSATNVVNGTVCFKVATNGNVENTNNSYGALSDLKLKENIVDANSQWDDLKSLQVRNYNFKEGQTHTQIGLVAQEVELVSPGLVSESPDRDEDGNDLGTVTKSVNYSVLYMKAVKALQEAMERIETLETANASLEARLTALEGGN